MKHRTNIFALFLALPAVFALAMPVFGADELQDLKTVDDYQAIVGNTGADNRVEFGTRLDHSHLVRIAELATRPAAHFDLGAGVEVENSRIPREINRMRQIRTAKVGAHELV